MTDKDERIEEGRKLLVEYDAADKAGKLTPRFEEAIAALEWFFIVEARYFLHDLPQRIEELEEALRPFAPTPEVLQAIQYIHDSGELYLGENGWQIGPITAGDLRRAASLLSASTEEMAKQATFIDYNNRVSDTPPQVHGDVERVADAVSKKLDYLSFGADIDRDGLMRTIAQTALSAMRPVSVDEGKLAEIRARHDSVADMADDEWDNRIYTIADDAFSDRAYLLSLIGESHDED